MLPYCAVDVFHSSPVNVELGKRREGLVAACLDTTLSFAASRFFFSFILLIKSKQLVLLLLAVQELSLLIIMDVIFFVDCVVSVLCACVCANGASVNAVLSLCHPLSFSSFCCLFVVEL